MGDGKGVKTIVFSAHDDGAGAFGVLCVIARALALEARGRCALRMIFLNSSVGAQGQPRVDAVRRPPATDVQAMYVPTRNLIRIPKDGVRGTVDPARIGDVLQTVRERAASWPCDEKGTPVRPQGEDLDWTAVDLAIGMGVPWLHRSARKAGIPSLEVGDMCFSLVLRGCLGSAGLQASPDDEEALDRIMESELMAGEAWLLPYMSPREYEAHFTAGGVPVHWLPGGALWTGEPAPGDVREWEPRGRMGEALAKDLVGLGRTEGAKVVCISAGATGVWDGIIRRLKNRGRGGKESPAVVMMGTSTGGTPGPILLEGGGVALPQTARLYAEVGHETFSKALYAASDLGIARSAGGALGFIAARTPAALADEPYHWLGARQREALARDRLCLPISRDELLQDPGGLISRLLTTERRSLEETKEHTRGVRIGVEWDLARTILTRYLPGWRRPDRPA